jgi:two-component system sensor histidine kinase DesK
MRSPLSEQPANGTRWTRYIWLVYLVSLVFQPVLDPTTQPIDWILTAALVAAFLPIYLATFRANSQRRQLLLIGALAALAFVGSFVNGGASVFVIYAAAAAAHLEPVRRAVAVIAGLVGLVVLMILVSPILMPFRLAVLGPALMFTIVIGAATIFEVERERANRRLVRAEEEIERLAALAERERIARDLHDLLGHTLSVIIVKSELAGRLLAVDADRVAVEIADIERIGREALTEVRSAVRGYRSLGLQAEIEGAERALAAADVAVTVERATLPALEPEHESALALALREAVTNVIRHAHAAQATIAVSAVGSDVVLEVADDGRGTTETEGSGLAGMRERIAAVGGDVVVDGSAGTRVRVRVPAS